MLSYLFWWGIWVAIILSLVRLAVIRSKQPKSNKIVENVNKHLYGDIYYKRREHEKRG